MQNDDLLANVTEVAGSKVLPPCVITGRLGRGGMGAVYRARHLNLAIDVAVKVLKPQLVSDDPSFVQRFKREGQSAAAISHQNVIRVFDVAEHSGLHYIIMELVVGETARQRVDRRGALPVAEAMQIVLDAANGLGAAHALGIVHRDVKPDNLLISSDGRLKVADLGLAKPTLGGGGASLMSAANQVMGTPSYMPPEQWESPAVGPAADVWALGVTAWFLLAGKDAFDSRDGNYPRVMKQIVLQAFPDLRRLRDDVPDAVLDGLAKATAKEARDRYADANEFAAALEDLGLPRTSLRDRTETTEAKTMVSPPLRNLDEIKQWLREDNRTRVQTPPGSKPAAAAGAALATPPPAPPAAPTTLPTPAPAGGTEVQAPSSHKRVSLVVAAGVIVLGGAAWLVFGNREPESDPLVVVRNLLFARMYEEGLRDLDAIVKDEPDLDNKALRVELLVGAAKAQRQKQQFAKALEQIGKAVALDPTLTSLQTEVRREVREAAQATLVVESPKGKVKRDEPISFVAQLDLDKLDAVKQLDVANKRVAPAAGGRFAAELQAGLREIAIGVELVDGHVAALRTVPVDYEEPALRPLMFRQPIAPTTAKVVNGVIYSVDDFVEVRGQVDAETCVLNCNGSPVVMPRPRDGVFTCRLGIGKPNEVVDLRVFATADGRAPAEPVVLQAIWLPKAPTFTIAPLAETDRLTTRVVVTAGLGTASATAKVGTQSFPLTDPAKSGTFTGDVELARGDNTIEVTTTDVLARPSPKQSVTVRCTIAPAAVTGVTFTAGGVSVVATRDGTYFVREAPTFTASFDGTRAALTVDGKPVAAGAPFATGSLTEGEVRRVTFLAANELGRDELTVAIVLDTTKPTITVESPASGAIVAPRQPTTLRGTWEDAGELAVLTVDGKEVAKGGTDVQRGEWSIELPGRDAGTSKHKIVARDRAGNETPIEHSFEVAALQRGDVNVPLQRFAGFESDGAAVNDLGYPKRIVHQATKIELIAADFADGKKPRVYIARRVTSEAEFAGSGGSSPKKGITGVEVRRWLNERGKALDLPTFEQRNGIADNRDFEAAASGPTEWVKPPSWNDDEWPLVNSQRATYLATDALSSFTFRVAFRLP